MFKLNLFFKDKLIPFFKRNVQAVRDFAVTAAPVVSERVIDIWSALDLTLNVAAKYLGKAFKKANTYKVKAIAVIMAAVLCFSSGVVAYAATLETAYSVRIGARYFGCVKTAEEAEAILESVRKTVHGNVDVSAFTVESATASPDEILTADQMTNGILNDEEIFESACGMYVDGVLMAVAEDFAAMQGALDHAVSRYKSQGMFFKGFANSVVLNDIFVTHDYAAKMAISGKKLYEGGYGTQFLTSRVEEYDEVIKPETVIQYNEKKKTNYEKVTQKGKDGLKTVVADVYYINGVRAYADEIECSVLKPATDKVVIKGTKETPVYHSGYVLATSIMESGAQMVFPVQCKGRTYITSFWGDGRGHKGLDISAPKGTNIFAAAAGTVVFSGWKNGYGNVIEIEHFDGKTQTVYSHNSKNLVKVGDEVIAGQLIGYVGISGTATGYHLHFEVRIDGKQVDAAPYVGLH